MKRDYDELTVRWLAFVNPAPYNSQRSGVSRNTEGRGRPVGMSTVNGMVGRGFRRLISHLNCAERSFSTHLFLARTAVNGVRAFDHEIQLLEFVAVEAVRSCEEAGEVRFGGWLVYGSGVSDGGTERR